MAEADWDEVTYLRKKPQRAADAKSQKVSAYNYCTVHVVSNKSPSSMDRILCCLVAQAVNQAQRKGEGVETSKKCKSCDPMYVCMHFSL